MKYRFSINADEVARQVGRNLSEVRDRVYQEVQKLSISAHAFIIAKANAELNGYIRQAFLGPDNKNVHWEKVADQIWAVTIDEKAAWIEEGRPAMFMRWLIDNNPKAKTAKDGSRYAHIPFTHSKLAGRSESTMNNPKAAYEAIVKKTMKDNGIPLKKIEKNADGSPKLGVLHRLPIEPPGTREQFPGMFSMPRSHQMAKQIGLEPHGGIFHLKGVMVVQRLNTKGKPVREAITIRTISTKHEAEGRWKYPEVPAFKSLEAASNFAQEEWAKVLEAIRRDYQ